METFVNQKINENLNIFIKKSEEDSAGSSESSMDVDQSYDTETYNIAFVSIGILINLRIEDNDHKENLDLRPCYRAILQN